MQELEFFYQSINNNNTKFINRKQFISSSKTIICGSTGSGKTALLWDYILKFKQEERLYVNLYDLRAEKDSIVYNLPKFLNQNSQIKTICIDNAIKSDATWIKGISKLSENFIVSTSDRELKIDNFSTLKLSYLDYEEFISFSKKNLDQNILFSEFLSSGSCINSVLLESFENTQYLQMLVQKTLTKSDILILKECALRHSNTFSAHEIYKCLKEKIKISKDSTYKAIYNLERFGFIDYLSKFNEPTSSKKLYFQNFALKNALTYKKDFNQSFKNAIFCELKKLKDEFFYTKNLDFFIPKRKLAIICMPFTQSEIIFLKFQSIFKDLKSLGVTKLQVISVANSTETNMEGIKCEIVPFYMWALSF